MRTILNLLLIAVSCLTLRANTICPEPTSKMDLGTAKSLSIQTGKNIVIVFHAQWCAPCRIMQDEVLQSPELLNTLNNNFITLKVDIDSKQGNLNRLDYNVFELPTTIVVDANGKELSRKTGTMSIDEFKSMVKPFYSNYKPSIPNGSQPKILAPKTEVAKSTNPPVIPAAKTANEVLASTMYSINVKSVTAAGYGVQVGVFSTFDKAMSEAARFQLLFPDGNFIIVHKENGSTTQYRLLNGPFVDEKTAKKMFDVFTAKKINGIVKDISLL